MLSGCKIPRAVFLAIAATLAANGALAAEVNGWTVETTAADDAPSHSDATPGFEKHLTLREAVARTLAYNPAIRAAYQEIEARHGEEVQSGLRPNPELLLEVENFGGNKDKRSFDVAEHTASLTQLIELGGKRMKRLEAARLDTSLAGWDYETMRMQMATLAAQSFVDVLTTQERVKVLNEFVTIADKTRNSVEARVKAGKASPIELDRSSVASARAKALARAENARLQSAKRKLAAFWGAHTIDFGSAAGRLGSGERIPSVEAIKAYLENNPSLARWSDEVNRRAALLDLEHAKAVPDVKLGAGVRQFNENDSTAVVASVAVPLPLFDRNEGNIAAAHSRLAKAEADARAQRNELLRSLIEAVGELEVAATQLSALKRDVLPVAQSAFDRTKLGYDEGKFDLLSVLDVQRSAFEVRLDLLNARAEYEKARVKVEALIGRDINGF